MAINICSNKDKLYTIYLPFKFNKATSNVKYLRITYKWVLLFNEFINNTLD